MVWSCNIADVRSSIIMKVPRAIFYSCSCSFGLNAEEMMEVMVMTGAVLVLCFSRTFSIIYLFVCMPYVCLLLRQQLISKLPHSGVSSCTCNTNHLKSGKNTMRSHNSRELTWDRCMNGRTDALVVFSVDFMS